MAGGFTDIFRIFYLLAVYAASVLLGAHKKEILTVLSNLKPVPGRLEAVESPGRISGIVDYAHTDDALKNVLTSLRELTTGRMLLTFGCGGSRDTTKRFKMGKVAAQLADYTIITTDNPRKESAEKIASQIVEGFVSERTDGFAIQLDRKRAIREIISMAKPGDTVLIAGKGHETYQEFEDTIVPFDDRIYAKETLETLGYNQQLKSKLKV